jgi:hypothetical protein
MQCMLLWSLVYTKIRSLRLILDARGVMVCY